MHADGARVRIKRPVRVRLQRCCFVHRQKGSFIEAPDVQLPHAGTLQSTSIRGNKLIKDFVAQGKAVDIYALPDHGLQYYGGFHVNLAAGLEDALVSNLKPPWNKAGIS